MNAFRVRVASEVLTGILAVRESGRTNMFDVNAVVYWAHKLGHDAAVTWVGQNRRLYVQGVLHGFEGIDPQKGSQ